MKNPRIELYPQSKKKIQDLVHDPSSSQQLIRLKGIILNEENLIQLIDAEVDKENPMTSLTFHSSLIGHMSLRGFESKENGFIDFEITGELIFSLSYEDLLKKAECVVHGLDIKNGKIDTVCYVSIYDFSRLYIRIKEIFGYPLSIINKSNIVIAGLGSGGSKIAVYLAMAGFKNFLFIDSDRFKLHNIVRHIGSMKDLGRYKTRVVKDYLLERVPDLNISTIEESFEINTIEDELRYKSVLMDYNLFISATGDHLTNLRINHFAYRLGLPVIYAGTFEKISGGIMIRVDPKRNDVCYRCIYSNSDARDPLNPSEHTSITNTNGIINDNGPSIAAVPNTIPADQSVVYDRNIEDLLSQPGLVLDIDNINVLVSKFILSYFLESMIQDGISISEINKNDENKSKLNFYSDDYSDESEGHKVDERMRHNLFYQMPHPLYIWYNGNVDHKLKQGDDMEDLELYFYDQKAINDFSKSRSKCVICGTKRI